MISGMLYVRPQNQLIAHAKDITACLQFLTEFSHTSIKRATKVCQLFKQQSA